MGILEERIKILLHQMELTQWKKHEVMSSLFKLPIISREELRNTKMEKGYFTTKTSGSTGIPLTVEKTIDDYTWFVASNIRDIKWRKWDVTKSIAHIKTTATEQTFNDWGIPKNIEPTQGVSYSNSYKPISELQEWLEKVNPHYINCFPSIFNLLDTSKLSNFIGWKGTGEVGGTLYSSEECGVIALECPDNPNVMHVMENHHVERDEDGGMIITTFTNPYIRRYKNGDHIEFGECKCGRGLQTISKIKGRVRNMFVLPNGDKKWPLIGSLQFYDNFGIKQYKAIQRTIDELELQIICEPLNEKEQELKILVKECINSPINVIITYVDEFPNYKHEEFISLI
jgi:phenylacetate-coenzyme A ligase PaaK-like adenylate-forming protein